MVRQKEDSLEVSLGAWDVGHGRIELHRPMPAASFLRPIIRRWGLGRAKIDMNHVSDRKDILILSDAYSCGRWALTDFSMRAPSHLRVVS